VVFWVGEHSRVRGGIFSFFTIFPSARSVSTRVVFFCFFFFPFFFSFFHPTWYRVDCRGSLLPPPHGGWTRAECLQCGFVFPPPLLPRVWLSGWSHAGSMSLLYILFIPSRLATFFSPPQKHKQTPLLARVALLPTPGPPLFFLALVPRPVLYASPPLRC